MCASCEDCPFVNSVESDWHEIHITCANRPEFWNACIWDNIKGIEIENLDSTFELMTAVKFKGTFAQAKTLAKSLCNKLAKADPVRVKIETTPSNYTSDGYWEAHLELAAFALNDPKYYVSKNTKKDNVIVTIKSFEKETPSSWANKVSNEVAHLRSLGYNVTKEIKEFTWHDMVFTNSGYISIF